jgi:hypothetical protein
MARRIILSASEARGSFYEIRFKHCSFAPLKSPD